MSDLTNRIDDLLFDQNKTRKEMYASLDCIHAQKFYEWGMENRIPSAIDVLKVAKYLNTTVEYLMTGEEDYLEKMNNNLRQKLTDINKLTSTY